MSAPWVKTDFTPIPKVSSLKKEASDDKAKDAAWRELCKYVNTRDGMRSRASGYRLTVTISRVNNRLEHHHLVPRSLGGQDTKENVFLLSAEEHDEVHVTRELHIAGNADVVNGLTFTRGGKTWRG